MQSGRMARHYNRRQQMTNGADTLCRRFPTGGGRANAAGINRLPDDQLEPFLDALRQQYSERA